MYKSYPCLVCVRHDAVFYLSLQILHRDEYWLLKSEAQRVQAVDSVAEQAPCSNPDSSV